ATISGVIRLPEHRYPLPRSTTTEGHPQVATVSPPAMAFVSGTAAIGGSPAVIVTNNAGTMTRRLTGLIGADATRGPTKVQRFSPPSVPGLPQDGRRPVGPYFCSCTIS